ncbi:MAG: hypothetical protein ACOYJ2_09105 [Rickettsiales bacterium]
MESQRLTDRLVAYWNLIRKESVMPEFAHFNKSAIADIWQQCMLFTVQPTADGVPPIVNFYGVGEKVKSLYTKDMTGQTITTGQKHFQGAALIKRIADVIAKPEPLFDQGQFVNERSKIVKYRSCMLPFGTDNRVTHVVVGLSWREF